MDKKELKSEVDKYMNEDYKIEVIKDIDYDDSKYFIAVIKELNGLTGTGITKEEAIEDLKSAKESYFQLNIELGREISLPIN